MSHIDRAVEIVRKAHEELGTAELARRAGLAYTTVNDCAGRQFGGQSIETLRKLAAAAEAHESEKAATAQADAA